MERETATNWGRGTVLTIGPIITIWAVLHFYVGVGEGALGVGTLQMYLITALVAWSPLPFSIPAVLLDQERDMALPHYRGVGRAVRAVRLLPHVLTRSPARHLFQLSIIGWGVAILLCLPYL